MSSSAPKFASFRPKPKAPAAEQPPEEPRREEKEYRQHNPKREGRRAERRSPPRENREWDRDDFSKKSYFSDRRGDHDIVKYGTLNRYDIPSYRRSGYGNVLGLSGQKIDREYSTEKKIYMTPVVPARQKRMLTDRHAAKESKRTLKLVKTAEDHHGDATRDFIALSSTHERKRGPGSGSEGEDNHTPDVDYRGIDDKRDPNDAADPDTYYESDTQTANANLEITQKNSRLIRETRDDPKNLQAWEDLIEHQESMMMLDKGNAELSAADRQNLADVRISLYEEALRKIGDDDGSRATLQLGLLREAERHWEAAKLAKKWHDVVKQYPRDIMLWFGYIGFARSSFSRFKYEDCRAAFVRCLQALQSPNRPNVEVASDTKLHLFVSMTTMIQESGYQELALAIWQAALEYNMLAPQHLTTNKMQQFEEFWESEAPRIGEPESKGWKHTSIEDAAPPTYSVTLDMPDSSGSVLDSFQRREVDSALKLRYPGRSTDEVDEDDPFHAIFFSDLKEYIPIFPNSSIESQIDAFLCFCGLPALATTDVSVSWRSDPFLQQRILPTNLAKVHSESASYQKALSRYAQCPVTNFAMTGGLLLQQPFSLDNSRLSPDFVRSTLKLLATNTSQEELVGEYLLAFEARYFPSEVAKSAKRLLKDRPSSVRLYTMYGMIKDRLGYPSKADLIFGNALNIRSASADYLQLLCAHVWQALQNADQTEALWRIVRRKGQLPNKHMARPDSVLIDITRTNLQDSLRDALIKNDRISAVFNTVLLALTTYLSSDCNVSAALEVHNNLISWLTSHNLFVSAYGEIHAQAIAHLLSYHATHTAIVKPALVRAALEPLIATFPSNTILLATYAANEARFSIDDRVHGNMHRVFELSPASSLATWAFAIHHETQKSEIAGSTSHSIRALYKRATASDTSGEHSPALWTMYLQFELEQLRKERELLPNKRPRRDGKKNKWESRVDEAEDRVKETFYQGLKMVPWYKDFIMMAFTEAREVFLEEELWRLYRMMGEKELRVYTEVEEPET